jgi:type VII secretion-associated serine protease mycosin
MAFIAFATPARPAAAAPACGNAPAVGAPTTGPPAVGTPAVGTPAVGTPAVGTPVVGTPVASAPVAGAPVAGAPVAGTPWAVRRFQPQRLSGIADGAGVVVAVLDSGVDGANPLLRGRVLAGTDELDQGGDGRLDCVGHGTAVASIVAAAASGQGFAGLAPEARILPVRVTEQEIVGGTATGRPGTVPGLVAAVRWAVAHGARVLNLSLVLYQDSPALREAVDDALRRDVVVVAAVGNDHTEGSGPDRVPYPAAYPGVIGVGAIGPDGQRLADSPVGSFVDIVAPGGDVAAAGRGGALTDFHGTSFAAPFVSATAALVRQHDPALSATEVASRILATADPAPDGRPSGGYGSGVVDPYRAVTEERGVARAAGSSPVPVQAVRAPHPATDRTGARATVLALAGGGLIGLVLLAAVIVPRGSRRGWRPGPS